MCICTYFCKLKMLFNWNLLDFYVLGSLFVCIEEGMKKLTTFPRVCKWCFYRSTIEKPVTITRNSIWAYHFERPNFLWHERVKHLSQIVANEKKTHLDSMVESFLLVFSTSFYYYVYVKQFWTRNWILFSCTD